MGNYVLGILWAIGQYIEEPGYRYFFLRSKSWYHLDAVRQEMNLKSNVQTCKHKGKRQYRIKISGFDINVLKEIGWRPRFSEQRDYPRIAEHQDFIRAYLELHSAIDTLTINDRRRNRTHKLPRLRIYGNKFFLGELTEILAVHVGLGIKKVQKATNISETSGILYYTSKAELRMLISYLWSPGTLLFHREYYEKLNEVLGQFKK